MTCTALKVINVTDVKISYSDRVVLDCPNLSICEGDFVSIVGPNGGGKTTLLKLVLGLIIPKQGCVKVFGDTPNKSMNRIGYMPQYYQYDNHFPITVLDVVLMGRLSSSFLGFISKKDRIIAIESLAALDVLYLKNHRFSDLSGGLKQRVLIARAVSTQPNFLLLDEPTSNVDINAENNIMHILQRLNEKMTVIMVSHDVGVVAQVVKTVICVNKHVVIHPTSDFDGKAIMDMYSTDMALIRHDHRCSEAGHVNE